jgi:hypothetical protein
LQRAVIYCDMNNWEICISVSWPTYLLRERCFSEASISFPFVALFFFYKFFTNPMNFFSCFTGLFILLADHRLHGILCLVIVPAARRTDTALCRLLSLRIHTWQRHNILPNPSLSLSFFSLPVIVFMSLLCVVLVPHSNDRSKCDGVQA